MSHRDIVLGPQRLGSLAALFRVPGTAAPLLTNLVSCSESL
jgi:hypothetical protein